MTDQTTIPQITETVAFADLYVSPFNPRTVVSDEEIASLAENIKIAGLIHNLAGFRHDGTEGVGVVAGGRRYRALALLQDDPRFHNVQVQLAADEDTAKLWATSENAQRQNLHPADEIRDYGTLSKTGMNAGQIAVAYGVTEKKVYRRLALADLDDAVLDALKAAEISLSQAKAFTISNDVKLTLEVLEVVKSRGTKGWGAMSDHQIKEALKPDHVKGTDRRAVFVGVEEYKFAGGRIGGDLFENETIFDDPTILQECFEAKLAATAAQLAEHNGWKWGEALMDDGVYYDTIERMKLARLYKVEGVLTDEENDRFNELSELVEGDACDDAGIAEYAELKAKVKGAFTNAQMTHAGMIMYVDFNGRVELIEGLVRVEDQAAAIEAGVLKKSAHKATAKKSPISAKLQEDLNRVVVGARQNALLDDPTLALDLLAYQLTQSQGYRRIHAYDVSLPYLSNVPETATGYTQDKRLSLPDPIESKGNEADDFAAFRKRGHKKCMDMLVRKIIGQLSISDADLADMIDQKTKKVTRDHFTPTAENFFKRVGGPYMIELWNGLLDLSESHDAAKSFATLKKGEKAAKLEKLFGDEATRKALGITETQDARIAAWLPEGMV
jgi:ParB family chromosome partitioning protein